MVAGTRIGQERFQHAGFIGVLVSVSLVEFLGVVGVIARPVRHFDLVAYVPDRLKKRPANGSQ
jgi:hypothetical protein